MNKNPAQKPTQRPTVRHLAEALNLSSASVAAALSGSGGNTRVSEKTQRRVLEMAHRMNYRVNSSARALNNRRFNNIGFFVVKKSSDDHTFAELVLDGIAAAAARHGQNVVLVRIPEYAMDTQEIPRALRETCLDALIVENVSSVGPAFREAVESSGMPVVYLNDKRAENAVYMHDVKGGEIMTRHLIEQGFARIAILAPDLNKNHYSFADRITGYQMEMRRAGREPSVWNLPNTGWKEQTRALLERKDRPDAIFCADDQIALCLQRILYALNIRIPERMAIAGCNDEAFAAHSMVPLTTLRIPFRKMSEIAVDMVMELIQDDARTPIPARCLVPELVVRESSNF